MEGRERERWDTSSISQICKSYVVCDDDEEEEGLIGWVLFGFWLSLACKGCRFVSDKKRVQKTIDKDGAATVSWHSPQICGDTHCQSACHVWIGVAAC